MTLAIAATGLVSGTSSNVTAPADQVEVVDSRNWNPAVDNYVTRLVQNGVSNSGVCPTVA